LRYNLVVDSVIDGNTPGWVFADRVENPSVALIWNRQDAILVAGDWRDASVHVDLRQDVMRSIVADARQRGIPALSLHYFPESWEGAIEQILQGRQPEKAQRRYYQPGPLKIAWQKAVPSGCQMRRIDQALLAVDFRHVMHVRGWVLSFWRSLQAFEETGFGFCLVQGETIASWSLSVYSSGKAYELGVATVPEYRNRGSATLTAAACVEHCLQRGWVPHWHCWEDNPASAAVAEKVGFVRPRRYSVYRFAPDGHSG
jgi:GNAT superfamily N-acetyltransferase